MVALGGQDGERLLEQPCGARPVAAEECHHAQGGRRPAGPAPVACSGVKLKRAAQRVLRLVELIGQEQGDAQQEAGQRLDTGLPAAACDRQCLSQQPPGKLVVHYRDGQPARRDQRVSAVSAFLLAQLQEP